MISALCTGRLVSSPSKGVTKSGKPYARATIACDVGQEDGVMVGLFVMDPESVDALLKAKKGDSIAAQGTLAPNDYVNKDGKAVHGLSLAFARVLTVRAPKRERSDEV